MVGLAASFLRHALMSVPSSEELSQTIEEGSAGKLKRIIVKRSHPGIAYGPYEYPMVSSEVWEAMKSAVGFYGTGAGTVF